MMIAAGSGTRLRVGYVGWMTHGVCRKDKRTLFRRAYIVGHSQKFKSLVLTAGELDLLYIMPFSGLGSYSFHYDDVLLESYLKQLDGWL